MIPFDQQLCVIVASVGFTSTERARVTNANGIARDIAVASERCPSLKQKHVTFHCLRHTTAMDLLHAGVEQTVIALWLGHESIDTTQIYLHAVLALKEEAIARTAPSGTPPGRYRPNDTLLAFLDSVPGGPCAATFEG